MIKNPKQLKLHELQLIQGFRTFVFDYWNLFVICGLEFGAFNQFLKPLFSTD